MSDSLWPHGLHSSWNSLGRNTGVGGHSLLQGIFPTQGSNPGLLHCWQILYQLSHKGSPRIRVGSISLLQGIFPIQESNQGLLHCRWILYQLSYQWSLMQIWASLVAQMVKNLPAMQKTWVQSLGREDPLEKEMATHSSTLTWRIPWTEEPGRIQSMGSQSVGHNWATYTQVHAHSGAIPSITVAKQRGTLFEYRKHFGTKVSIPWLRVKPGCKCKDSQLDFID